jgi:hypothetical protein
MLAAAAVTAIDDEVVVSEPSVAVNVQFVPVVMVTPENVATPLTAFTVNVPVKVQVEEIVTASELDTVLPTPSSIVTTKVDRAVPAVVEDPGSVVNTICVAFPLARLTEDDVPTGRPVDAAESVNGELVTRPESVTPVKVATPFTAFTLVAPPRVPELLTLSETLAELEVTTSPY